MPFDMKFLSRKKIQIGSDKRKYRSFYQVLSLKVGNWKELPKISHVSVIEQPGSEVNNRMKVKSSDASYRVYLYTQQGQRIEAFEGNFEEARNESRKLSGKLSVPKVDFTGNIKMYGTGVVKVKKKNTTKSFRRPDQPFVPKIAY